LFNLFAKNSPDYTDHIKGVGPVKALQWITQHRNMDKVLANMDRSKYTIPDRFDYKAAAELFRAPEVNTDIKLSQLVWKDADVQGVIVVLVQEKGFNLEKVKSGLDRMRKAKHLGNQQRLDSFFTLAKTSKKRKDQPILNLGAGRPQPAGLSVAPIPIPTPKGKATSGFKKPSSAKPRGRNAGIAKSAATNSGSDGEGYVIHIRKKQKIAR